VIAEHPGYVIDFGAGSYCFEIAEEIESAEKVFAPIANAVLLQPSADLGTSILSLPGVRQRRYMNTYFIMHPMNQALSKHTIFTVGKSPEESADDVIRLVT
jgi:hypothetical protein